jgi:hypothetical protein
MWRSISPSATKQFDFHESQRVGFYCKDLSGKLEFHESDTSAELGEIWCRLASTAVERFVSFVKIGALKSTLSGRN